MKKKRVVTYVRVSSASDSQMHSYEFQAHYWQKRFELDDEFELVAIYADKGISGKSMHRRPQFMKMLEDGRKGYFDMIYTKSVSRFARNAKQLLECVRELRDLGIGVYFEKEKINTLDPKSELYMTIAASIAENDLEVDASRQRWSIQQRCENGWISIGSGMYGYRMVDGEITIVPEEAAVVRAIYDMYISGTGVLTIARVLNEQGLTTSRGNPWSSGALLGLISNEKYMGDAMMGKSVSINGEKRSNMHGEYGERYYTEDSHEGIVSKDTWRMAQEIRKQRENPKLIGQEHPVYPFTGIITCSQCGAHYQHKVNCSGKKWQTDIWACATSLRKGVSACDCTRIKDTVLKEKFVEAYNEFVTKRPLGIGMTAIQVELERLIEEEKQLAALAAKRLITKDGYAQERRQLQQRQQELQELAADLSQRHITEADYRTIDAFDEKKAEKFITAVKIAKNQVTFTFFNGVEISRNYTNGQPGNKLGWNKKG